jgi:hypothetical protein
MSGEAERPNTGDADDGGGLPPGWANSNPLLPLRPAAAATEGLADSNFDERTPTGATAEVAAPAPVELDPLALLAVTEEDDDAVDMRPIRRPAPTFIEAKGGDDETPPAAVAPAEPRMCDKPDGAASVLPLPAVEPIGANLRECGLMTVLEDEEESSTEDDLPNTGEAVPAVAEAVDAADKADAPTDSWRRAILAAVTDDAALVEAPNVAFFAPPAPTGPPVVPFAAVDEADDDAEGIMELILRRLFIAVMEGDAALLLLFDAGAAVGCNTSCSALNTPLSPRSSEPRFGTAEDDIVELPAVAAADEEDALLFAPAAAPPPPRSMSVAPGPVPAPPWPALPSKLSGV